MDKAYLILSGVGKPRKESSYPWFQLTQPTGRKIFAFLSNSKLTITCNQCETATTLNSCSPLMNFCSKQHSPVSSQIPIKANLPLVPQICLWFAMVCLSRTVIPLLFPLLNSSLLNNNCC